MTEKFYIPDLVHYLRAYIKECHMCQIHRKEKPQLRQLYLRINPDYKASTRLNMGLRVMSISYKGHTFIILAIDEVTNVMMTIPIHKYRSEEIDVALIELSSESIVCLNIC